MLKINIKLMTVKLDGSISVFLLSLLASHVIWLYKNLNLILAHNC